MFKYINMSKYLAYLLKEFSVRKDTTTPTGTNVSYLYKFLWCCCLPFAFQEFRKTRLDALRIAECTNSFDQISRVLFSLTGATLSRLNADKGYSVPYGNTGTDKPDFAYDNTGTDNPVVPYGSAPNSATLFIALNGASVDAVEAVLPLLIPFYLNVEISYI